MPTFEKSCPESNINKLFEDDESVGKKGEERPTAWSQNAIDEVKKRESSLGRRKLGRLDRGRNDCLLF